MQKRTKKIILALSVVFLFLLGTAAWYLWPYKPAPSAVQAMQGNNTIKVTTDSYGITIEPAYEPIQQVGIIFFPGAKVEPESYAPLARDFATLGYRTIIVRMPLNLAQLGENRANLLMNRFPDQPFVIGGHSMGGTYAARYTASKPSNVKGLFFLGAYSDQPQTLPVLSILASHDQVLDQDTYNRYRSNLPKTTQTLTVEGGNHAQFGDYGPQKGDGLATITPEEQRTQVVQAVVKWVANIGPSKVQP
ncbi:alpha/beta fold hydrolase [Paenibacillus terrigena]|uniref:alpha/beta fold hydrolase n=1 Tax=Paenibacillus terrigena TaxID=369333 RepID=UPI000376608E|nr:alpha/beta fold hydrolase [Paenibacillus terrigena]